MVVGDRKMAVFDDTHALARKTPALPPRDRLEKQCSGPRQGRARASCRHPRAGAPAPGMRAFPELHRRRGTTPVTDGREGLRVLRVLNASQQSLNQHGAKNLPAGFPLPEQKARAEAASRPLCPRDGRHRRGLRYRGRHEDLALLPRSDGMPHRRELQHRPERGHRTRRDDREEVQDPEQRERLQGRDPGGRRLLRPFHGLHQHLQPPGGDTPRWTRSGPRWSRRGPPSVPTPRSSAGPPSGATLSSAREPWSPATLPDHALVVGNPARQIGWVCECGERLPDKLVCTSCGNPYVITHGKSNEILKKKKSSP